MQYFMQMHIHADLIGLAASISQLKRTWRMELSNQAAAQGHPLAFHGEELWNENSFGPLLASDLLPVLGTPVYAVCSNAN